MSVSVFGLKIHVGGISEDPLDMCSQAQKLLCLNVTLTVNLDSHLTCRLVADQEHLR